MVWIIKSFQVVSCIHPLFNFLRRKIHMSYFRSMPRLSVIFHMNICITTHIVVNLLNSIENLFYDKLSNINDEAIVYVHIYESQIHSNDQVSLGEFYQVLNLILMDGFHIVFFMVFKPYSGVS